MPATMAETTRPAAIDHRKKRISFRHRALPPMPGSR
jgi:hypothetical protein